MGRPDGTGGFEARQDVCRLEWDKSAKRNIAIAKSLECVDGVRVRCGTPPLCNAYWCKAVLSARTVVEKLFGQLQGELLSGAPLFRNQVDPGELLIEISAI